MSPADLYRQAYSHGVQLALKEADARVERPAPPVERPMHHDIPVGSKARFGARGSETLHKQSEEIPAPEPDYIRKAREYADKYHKALLARFKSEHETKSSTP